MSTATRNRRPLALVESYAVAPARNGLRVDQENGVIYGVRVLGQFSPNGHGRPGVTKGTEYTTPAMKTAVPLYEGVPVYCNHPDKPTGRSQPVRDVREAVGVLRNPRFDAAGSCIRADLHYYKSHPMAGPLAEDAHRGLGAMALSHNASAGRERVSEGKLLIEEIASVKSVDIVSRGATNRNLWEAKSEPVRRRYAPTSAADFARTIRTLTPKPPSKLLGALLEDKPEARPSAYGFAKKVLEEVPDADAFAQSVIRKPWESE